MVIRAEATQIVEVGRPLVAFPLFDVVGDPKEHVATAREATVPIPAHDLAALGGGGRSDLAPLVEGVAHVVVDGDDELGVTGQPPDDVGADQSASLELAAEL